MTSKSNILLVTNYSYHERCYLLYLLLDSNRKPLRIYMESKEQKSLVGNIYIGRVSKIMEKLQAAFVDIAPDVSAYLPYDEKASFIYTRKLSKKSHLCQGDEILIEIKRDAIKSKEATADYNLHKDGRHCILTSSDLKIGISKKISDDRRNEIKNFLEERFPDREFGIIVRTDAANLPLEDLANEISTLMESFHNEIEHAKATMYPSLISKRPSYLMQLLRNSDFAYIGEILTDQADLYHEILLDMDEKQLSEWKEYVHLYNDISFPMKNLYSIDSILDRCLNTTIHLKSGANIMIEQLETVTFIDVNSANNLRSSKSHLEVNLEAASEIANQMILRNLSGMILVDFINMKSKDEEEELLRAMREYVRCDHRKVRVLDFTKLGLMEITREKKYISLKQMLTS